MTQWKEWPIDSRYTVSDDGQVRSPSGLVLVQRATRSLTRRRRKKDGSHSTGRLGKPYMMVSVSFLRSHPKWKPRADGRCKGYRVAVHRMVCMAWHGMPPTDKHQAAHINGDSLDNRAVNLCWATPRVNNRDHRIAQGHDPQVVPYQMPDGWEADPLVQTGDYAQVAEHFGVSYAVARRALLALGVRKVRACLTDEQIEDVKALALTATRQEVARAFGVTPQAIAYRERVHGFQCLPATKQQAGARLGYGPRVLSAEQIDAMAIRRAEGAKVKRLAREFSTSVGVVKYWLERSAMVRQ